jgi:exopolysaccharide production protein ExoY
LASISMPPHAATGRDPYSLKWRVANACERAASMILAVALGPLIAASAVCIALLSKNTPFIAHRRVGWRGATLWMLKLRTMWGAEASPRGLKIGMVEYIDNPCVPESKHPADPRVTSGFARFCRRHSIDELPQLWHVVRGEMSLVGPRPMTREEMRLYYKANAAQILDAKPGIAGLWQVSGRNQLSYAERCKLDLQMVRQRSLRLYFTILLRTIPEVVVGKNSF